METLFFITIDNEDLVSELSYRGFECTTESYKSGKYYSIKVDNYDETFEEVLQFILEEYDPNYFGSLAYSVEEDSKFNFYINI